MSAGYREATSEQRPVRRLAFHRLPAAVQRALSRSLADGGAPRPLVSEVRGPRPPSARRWTILLGVAIAVDLVAWIAGFGDRLDDPALSPLALALLHAAAIATGLFAALYSNRLRKQHLGVRHPAGKHVFELDLVEVEGSNVVVTPLDTLKRIEARPGDRHPSIALVFTDGHEVVFANQSDAEAQAESARRAIEAARLLVFPQDLAHLEKVDPFLELRIGDDWRLAELDSPPAERPTPRDAAPTQPPGDAAPAPGAPYEEGARRAVRSRRAPLRMLAAACAVAGALAGTGMFFVGRAHLVSLDDARFEDATQKPEELRGAALEEYIARGGRHVDEAETALFDLRKDDEGHLAEYIKKGGPRAKLAEDTLFELQRRNGNIAGLAEHVAQRDRFADKADDVLFELVKQRGTSAAFSLYLERGKRHASEVESTLLPDAVFAEARKSKAIHPLVAFAQTYPHSPHAAEARTLVHGFYTGAFESYKERKQPSARARAFFEALLASVESRDDPRVQVRATMADLGPVLEADRDEISQHGKDYQPAAPRLGSVDLQVEGLFKRALLDRFPDGILDPRSASGDLDDTLPLFDVVLTPVPDGALVSQREQIRFTSVKIRVDVRATIPGRSQKLVWGATSLGLRSFDFSVKASREDEKRSDRADFARQVYDRMIQDMLQWLRDGVELRL